MARPRIPQARRKAVNLPSVYGNTSAESTMLQLKPHVQLDKLRDGTADRDAWKTLKYRINEASILAVRHHPDNDELRDALATAVHALCTIGHRYTELRRFGCSGDEFRAIGRALGLADELQTATTRRKQLAASVLMHLAPRAAQ